MSTEHTHKSSVGFVGRTQKTARTECGRIVKVSAIAINSDCSCPECVAIVDSLWSGHEQMVAHARGVGLDTTDLEKSLAAGRALRYQTVPFDQLVGEALRGAKSGATAEGSL